MSDSIEELSKAYTRNVLEEHARSVGLFTIPEYPEFEAEPGMWSTALNVILTTLRYLAPATLLTIFWGQQSFLFKLVKYIDSAFRSLVYTCDEQKQTVLQWLESAGTVRVDRLETVWRHGWIVCGVLDLSLPGACAGHPPTKLSLAHAQTIAKDYLGVEPIFTRQELESIDTLGKHQEWKLIAFLDNIRLAISKLTPTSTKPSPIRFAAESTHHTFDYIAKGSGLTAAQVNNKAYFKIYPTAQQSLNPGDITIEIKGPKKSHGTFTIPPILGKAQMIRQSLLGRKSTSNYTENILPITQGVTYLRNFGKNDMCKTYFIPKIKNTIEIETEANADHVKIGYTVEFKGKYEISIMSKNLSIAGSPFSMIASDDIVETLENDNFSLEDGEEIDIVDVTTDRKVVLRIVDFVTEKMLLKDNGCLEKISNDKAKQLMESDNIEDKGTNMKGCENVDANVVKTDIKENDKSKSKIFYEIAKRVIIMTKVCRCFLNFKKSLTEDKNTKITFRNQDIPDVVNSTFNDYKVNADVIPAICDRYIVPENISVALVTEKEDESKIKTVDTQKSNDFSQMKSVNYGPFYEDVFEDPINTHNSDNNIGDESYVPDYSIEKEFGSFIMSEYETNNSQSEETQRISMELEYKKENEFEKSKNPFTEKLNLDLTKSTFDKKRHNMKIKELSNPFIVESDIIAEKKENTDFIIGAPVSSLPNLTAISTDSLNSQNSNTSSDNTASCDKSESNSIGLLENTQLIENNNIRNNTNEIRLNDIATKREVWDSAYVSIDENNSSDVTVHENYEVCHKHKLSYADSVSNIVPINSEVLDHFNGKQDNMFIEFENCKKSKYDTKRLTFTPIQEEIDKIETSEKSCKSDCMSKNETDSVAEAFAELDHIYEDYFSNHEIDSNTVNCNTEVQCEEINHAIHFDTYVDSASEKTTDVKRQTTNHEGKTSEVQAQVTELVSASQILHTEGTNIEENNNINIFDGTQFGDKIYSNIVVEKKNFWDEKIKQIEAKAEELKSLNKRRLSSKYLRRNDSLTKRRGKKIVQNFLKSNEIERETDNNTVKLKGLRNYWDNHVQMINSIDCFGMKTEKDKGNSKAKPDVTSGIKKITMDKKDSCNLDSTLHTKQDLSEKVFEAFETSPKRFFGTSRQHIINKIDTFLAKSEHDDENKSITSEISHDSGLVSSRISLFHNISKTEPLPTSYRKHKSLNNVYTEKVSIDRNFTLKVHPKSFNSDNESSSLKIDKVVHIDKNANIIKEPIVSFQVKKLEDNDVLKNEDIDTNISITQVKKSLDSNDPENDAHLLDKRRTSITTSLLGTESKLDNNNRLKNNLTSFSKSEMDIFNKVTTTIDVDFDKHKSYDELPTISVKKFISLYEDVCKSSDRTKCTGSYKKSQRFQGNTQSESSTGGTAKETQIEKAVFKKDEYKTKIKTKPSLKNNNFESDSKKGSPGYETMVNDNKHGSCLSLSDMDIEIIEDPEDTTESEQKTEVEDGYTDYKNRFKMAKQYFKSLEELRIDKKPKENKENKLINDIAEESPESNVKVKKSNIQKSNSMPSSELTKIWNEIQEDNTVNNSKKLMKISEKFNVEDLYEDVMDGRLSRQGSLRGIPNKKAVLETFRSMENVNTKNFNSYEFATTQLSDFANENKIRNAQTYLSEYPYLPTTDPSKYHSRFDASASGLITFKELKELKENRRIRRNSVPDTRISPIFTESL